MNDRSLFDSRRIDGVAAADELIAFYVNNPDLGSGTFASKLKAQLADASDDAIQVAAELLYVHTLVASTTTWSARSKAELVNAVTSFRATGVTPMPPDLETALAGGAAGTGQAYLNYRWKMFSYLIGVFATIKRLPIEDRQLAVASLDGFRPRNLRGGHAVGVDAGVRAAASADSHRRRRRGIRSRWRL